MPGVWLESESGEEYQAEEKPINWEATLHGKLERDLRGDKPLPKDPSWMETTDKVHVIIYLLRGHIKRNTPLNCVRF